MPTDLSKEPEVTVIPTKKITEKYNSSVIVKRYAKDSNSINCQIGNSGLQVRIFYKPNPIEYKFDYYPNIENNSQNNSAIKSNIFGSALLSFRNWLNDPINEKEYNFDKNKITNLSNFTNPKMANYINKLFSENGHKEMVKIDETVGTYIEIDLRKFCELPNTDQLIQYLNKLHNRVKDINLTYDKETR